MELKLMTLNQESHALLIKPSRSSRVKISFEKSSSLPLPYPVTQNIDFFLPISHVQIKYHFPNSIHSSLFLTLLLI